MFGHYAFGDAPFGGLPDPAVRMTATANLRADFRFTIYAASAALLTAPDDTPASTPFHGTLAQPISFRRSLLGDSAIGVFSTGDGTMSLDNRDGRYDFLIGTYSIDGRRITLKIGRIEDNYATDFPIFVGTAADWLIDEDSLTITIRDFGYRLNVPLQQNLYGGTGGADGGADLAGKRKPLAFGQVFNVTPPLVVPNLLIYQVHDGEIESADSVYDRGTALTFSADYATYADLSAATVAAGYYATCLAFGFIKLGSTPAGTVTADLHGDADGGYVETSADIVRRIVNRSTDIEDTDEIYLPAFAAVNTAQPAPIGYWSGTDDGQGVDDAVANIMAGVGGWAGFRRNGKFEVGIVLAPTSPPSSRFTVDDIAEIKREPLPSGISPPPYRFRIGYQRNETQQTDLAGSVSADRKAFAAEQYRFAEASSTAIRADHPFALDADPIEAYFVNLADAQAEATRRLNLYRASRGLYRIKLNWRSFNLNLGENINVTFPRWDLTVGRALRLVEINEDGAENSVEIVGFG
jgi:hypothetical protein